MGKGRNKTICIKQKQRWPTSSTLPTYPTYLEECGRVVVAAMAGRQRGGRDGKPLAGTKGLTHPVVQLHGGVRLAEQRLKLGEAALCFAQVVLGGLGPGYLGKGGG